MKKVLKRAALLLVVFLIINQMTVVFAQANETELTQEEQDNYVKSHQNFINTEEYKNLTSDYKNEGSFRYAPVLRDGYEKTEVAEKAWNIISLNWYQNNYDVVLCDLLMDEELYNWQAEELAKKTVSNTKSIYTNLVTILTVDWKNQYNLDLPEKEINTFLNNNKALSEDTSAKLSGLFKNSALKEKYKDFFKTSSGVTDNVSEVLDWLSYAESVKDYLNFAATVNAYLETSEAFKQALNDIQVQAEMHNQDPAIGTDEFRQLSSSIQTYINMLDPETKGIEYAKEYVQYTGKPTYNLFKKIYESQIKNFFLKAQLKAGLPAETVSNLSATANAIQVGYTIGMLANKFLTANDTVMLNIDLIRSAATLEQAATSALSFSALQFGDDPSYFNAEKVHHLKNIEIFSEIYALNKYKENLTKSNDSAVSPLIRWWNNASSESYDYEIKLCENYIRNLNKINCDKLIVNSDPDAPKKDVTLVLDISGSMDGEPIEKVKEAAKNFISVVLQEDVNVGIVAFESAPKLIFDYQHEEEPLIRAIDSMARDGAGDTDMGAGLEFSNLLSNQSDTEQQTFVVMTDGLPNSGMNKDELINYCQYLKNHNKYIYTLGFFDAVGDSTEASNLLEKMASPSSYFEAGGKENLYDIFDLIANFVSGNRYIYVKAACPVNVKVEHDGEVLDSSNTESFAKTSFGVLTYQDSEDPENPSDKVKVLRLKEGPNYDISISGTGEGSMNYQIGLMDENGEYEDYRYFNEIAITPQTQISTSANTSKATMLSIDNDGDGSIDQRLIAGANENGREYNTSWVSFTIIGIVIVTILLEIYLTIRIHKKKKRNKTKI